MSDTPRTDAARDYSCPEKMDTECQKMERELNAANARIAELEAIIARSDLRYAEGYKANKDATLVPCGTILVHKEHVAVQNQRTKDLQAHANTARKLAECERQLTEARKDSERWDFLESLICKDEWPRHIEIFPRKGKIRLHLTTTVRFLKQFTGSAIREVIDQLRAAIDAARKEKK